MWCAITKIFTKNNSNKVQSGENKVDEMDRGENKRLDMDIQDSYDTRQAKQRASVKWLLSKAFNNKVPENLKEPFYRDHENQEHLKPQIIGSLANAEIYCLALGNIYSDPNYHNLNHWSILQTLARKGVYVTEPSDAQLTETTLIQTNPLKMSAHMAVIESIMILYAKEVVTPDRVLAAVQRFNHGQSSTSVVPETHEQGLLLWVSHACNALKKRIDQDLESTVANGGEGDRLRSPKFPTINDLKDLCDGVGLAALISYYCPDELPWPDLRVSFLPTVQESLHNLNLVQNFCQRCLPSSVFHMMPEDVTYMRGSMKQNLVVFLADIFNVLEIHPVKCVRYPGMDKLTSEGFPLRNAHGVVHKRNLPQSVMSPIPDLRSGLDDPATPAFQVIRSTPTHAALRKTNSFQQSTSEMSEDSLRRGSDDSFVVHRSKNIPTLSSVRNDEPLIPARLRINKEKQNNDSKSDERGDTLLKQAAGKPSNWEENRKSTYAGRRSRRNSTSDDSQLTIENFGGSQDNINFIGRNPDKEVAVHIGRKLSAPPIPIENPAVRSSIQDARGSFQLGYDNGCEKQDEEREKFKLKRQLSSDDISLRNIVHSQNKENIITDLVDGETLNRLSSAEFGKSNLLGEQRNVHLVYMQQDKEEMPSKSSFLNKSNNTNGSSEKKTTTFAALPNTTTWQQQSSNNQHMENNISGEESTSNSGQVMSSQLNDVRMKLEEKRRHIENEKRRMEVAMNKQRQKVGKAAFLQAVVKGKGNLLKTPPDSESTLSAGSEPNSPSTDTTSKPQRPVTLQDISDDATVVERKWMDQEQPFVETRRTPDFENMDMEQYQQSISQMNSSLHDIQADIQRLASQQSQIQAAQQQTLLAQQQKQLQALQQQQLQTLQQQQQQLQSMHQHPQYSAQQSYMPPQLYQRPAYNPIQTSASAPHIPQTIYNQPRINQDQQQQFFLHDQAPVTSMQQQQPVVPQRRTWAQQAPPSPAVNEHYHQPELRTWAKPQGTGGGFILHDTSSRYDTPKYQQDRYHDNSSHYQNGSGDHSLNHSNSFTLSQQHMQQQQLYTTHSTPSASPQHRNVHRQISQLMEDNKHSPVSLQQIDREPLKKVSVIHAPIPAPSVDDMEPQNISFIGNPEEHLNEGISRLNITSGTRTYRIPSPTRPLITRNSFQQSPPTIELDLPLTEVSSLDNDPTSQKGFYISFDDEQPKRPKPPLRMKKGSPKKERNYSDISEDAYDTNQERAERKKLERESAEERMRKDEVDRRRLELVEKERQKLKEKREASQDKEKIAAASAIIIGNELSNPDPDLIDERERKKERIMLLSLQRRQQQEELKERKEQEAQARREREKAKEEEKQRKKEEQAARRAAILEQYKFKKAIEEAEREGKVLDKSELMSSKPVLKIRPKGSTVRPRPKTIHIDSGSVEMAEGMLQPSRGKKGSSSNLTANSPYAPSTIKRDYYRGSQDSLADRGLGSGLLYKDSPDDSRGMSPCHSANQTLGRRSSYKTSRDPSPAQVRGRPKYSTYQNFKGRKSNSMMNLYGSSTDQDSLAYRYGDTDSGLGRATPPRRAPSPGMGPMRHLTSPSGPGSLPGLMSKRRVFDDGSSDISSTPSSMMDYNGPRLYKQPATKSNRGIMLNAVEYCVFPGVVNREAKRRVLEEIGRSESKHFLILFRDAGCQFRALYSYCPDGESDEVTKLYGTGPKQVNDRMFDKFFKYNSGGKCFSQVHTKHLTVTIDAFTIHNSLWQGKKVNLPNKKDMALVI